MSFLPDIATPNIVKEITEPSKTYQMLIKEERINGTIDGLNAIAQACYKILNTERYDYAIYSWDYGVELRSLFGKSIPYVFSELPRRIKEALMQDDRIINVDSFRLTHKKGDVLAEFTVHTTKGEFDMTKGVKII